MHTKRSKYEIALIVIYALGLLSGVYRIIRLLLHYPIWNVIPDLIGDILILLLLSMAIYLIIARKKIAFKTIVSVECVRIITSVIAMIIVWSVYIGMNPFIRGPFIAITIFQIAITPIVVIWLAYKSKNVFIN